VALNQLAFPGAGTVMAGRPVGYVQATIMVAGFVLTMWYLLVWINGIFSFALSNSADETQYKAGYQAYTWTLQYGVALTLVAWFWSLVSSIAIVRSAKKEPPLLPGGRA
jgi:hypothetical protein